DDVREAAQAGLDRMGLSHEQAISLCVRQLGVAVHAEAALRKSGQLGAPALIEALASNEHEVRVKAICALEGLGEKGVDAIPALTGLMSDKNMEVRLAALKALWNISKSAEMVVAGLIALLDTRSVTKLMDSETRRRFLQTV